MDNPVAADPATRRKALLAIAAVVALVGVGYGAYWLLVLNHYESTDNAYVQGHVVTVTPLVGGTVLEIGADDTDFVKAGTTLVRLDTADARVVLDQAEAQLAQAVREARTVYAGNDTLGAQVAVREAELARAATEVRRWQDDAERRAPLVADGTVSREDYDHALAQAATARAAVVSAQAAVAAAREQLAANRTQTDGGPLTGSPAVQRAAARVREAWLALARADVPAPIAGHVVRRAVQLGQRVQPGAALMSLVALDQLWVDANFKEGQLRSLRIGQPVTLTADVYGSAAEYHGTVAGLGAGTGAAFALLPAQNATGNWIKVVQRVPVRIRLDPAELAAKPLRIGLSMEVRVDTAKGDGEVLARTPRTEPAATTHVFDRAAQQADERVAQIIAANLGRAPAAQPRVTPPRVAPAASRPST
jgi:membrane fusion protein (multidrug efflux system)